MSERATPPKDSPHVRPVAPSIRTQAEAAIHVALAAVREERLSLNQIADLVERQPGATERHDVCEDGVRVAIVCFADGTGVGVHERGLDHLVPARGRPN